MLAVEPSAVMIAQRPRDAAPAVRARAEALPLRDGSVDAALAVLTVHHWTDQGEGLAELRRVARQRAVLLTWDPGSAGFWLVQDYFPEILALDRVIFPPLAEIEEHFRMMAVEPLAVPADCADGFLGAFWRRPAAYLDPRVRASISSFGLVHGLGAGLRRLEADLTSGAWAERHGRLLSEPELDIGYRLVIGEI